jgi:hypothetical protein
MTGTPAPGLPFQIYGKVTDANGAPVPDATITVYVKGTEVAKSITDAQGKYGIAPHILIISDSDGSLSSTNVTFAINEVSVPQVAIFEPGALKEIDFEVPISVATKNAKSGKLGNFSFASTSTQVLSNQTKIPEADVNATNSDDFTYKTPIFHIKKHKPAPAYKPKNKPNAVHSEILGAVASTLVLIMLVWVYFQNYLHHKRQNP